MSKQLSLDELFKGRHFDAEMNALRSVTSGRRASAPDCGIAGMEVPLVTIAMALCS